MNNSVEPTSRNYNILFLAIGVIIAGIIGGAAYFLGTVTPSQIQQPITTEKAQFTQSQVFSEGGSKIRGNKKSRIYHLPNCPNYNDIAEQNIVDFKTHEEAKAAGYRMARNCP